MNVFIAIMLIFSAMGFLDKAFGGRFGLANHFEKGLYTMGAMVIPIVSICAVGTEFVHRHTDQVAALSEHLFFDPSMIIGAILAPDMGGYFICREIAADSQLLILSGVVLGTLLGQAITFQMPVFIQMVDKSDHPSVFQGFIVGIIMIPAGLVVAELMMRMDLLLFLRQFLPIFALCMIIAAGLHWAPKGTANVFAVIARIVNWLLYLMFAVTILGLFVPKLQYASMESLKEAMIIVLKLGVIIAGALVMSELIMKYFRPQIQKIADRIGINEVSAIALLMTCATSLAAIPLFPEMNEKGKQVVSAFSLSGSFVIGGSMAFVSNVTGSYNVLIFIVTKLVCGVLSAWLVCRLYRE